MVSFATDIGFNLLRKKSARHTREAKRERDIG